MRVVKSRTAPKRPEGTEFRIDTVPWYPASGAVRRPAKATTGVDVALQPGRVTEYMGGIRLQDVSLAEDRVIDWPMVYILTNDEEAYVGQTKSALHRMEQHSANEEKSAFREASLIYCDEFNMSVITDYEHRLIQLMSADGVYRLTNKNDGMQDGNYFSKAEYARMFEDLWEDLRGHRLPDGRKIADKSIREIEESELFKYSPYKSLNSGQVEALESILEAIRSRASNPSPVVVEGMPGTGKTVLAVFLLKMLKDMPEFEGANIRLVEPMPSLRKTLKRVLQTVGGLSSNDVIGPGDVAKQKFGYVPGKKKCFDVLLVDESHRLKQYRNIVGRKAFIDTSTALGLDYHTCSEVDWIMDQAQIPVFFYDPLQAVKPSSPSEAQFLASVGKAAERPISLTEQMRCGGGSEYLDYVRNIIWGCNPEAMRFEDYTFELHEDFLEFQECFEETLAKNDLTRMVAGFAWPWATKDKPGTPPEFFDIEIEGVRLKWNSNPTDSWVDRGLDNLDVAREVGCIHTIQGYDLSNAFVIIGPDLKFDAKHSIPKVDRSSYFDSNGKNGTSEDELLSYIRNIYYVLLTRGIESTHVYVCDDQLRSYFRRFFFEER